ncbi:hypothetical protein A5678_16765 [Mycobacterium sp. E2733]|nr:hypothetical protein A5678_16765 [Mycobacterium sp. E2733]
MPVIVGLHHIVLLLASWVVACKTVQASPGAGASARATGETAANIASAEADKRIRNLFMMDAS